MLLHFSKTTPDGCLIPSEVAGNETMHLPTHVTHVWSNIVSAALHLDAEEKCKDVAPANECRGGDGNDDAPGR